MGNIFSQTDDLYQPEPALHLVPVTPSQGNALRGGASRHVSRERAFNLPDANVRRLHRGRKLARVTAWPVYRQERALRAYASGIIIQRFQAARKDRVRTKSKEQAGQADSKTFNNYSGFERS